MILVCGIHASAILFLPHADWIFYDEDGDAKDSLWTVSVVGGILLCGWILHKIHRSEMNDQEKSASDARPDDDSDW